MKRARIETQHSEALATWAATQSVTIPDLKWLVHWPNEGKRDRRTVTRKDGTTRTFCPSGVQAKRMGAKAGALDYWLFATRADFSGMAFELKAPGEKLSKEQADWTKQLLENGWHVPGPFYSWDEAARAVIVYLALPPRCYSTTAAVTAPGPLTGPK
jgi:hypothetical protein